MCFGQCSASCGSVKEGWQVGGGEANYFRRYIGDFQELVSIRAVVKEQVVQWRRIYVYVS